MVCHSPDNDPSSASGCDMVLVEPINLCVCVCACVRACVHVCVCVHVGQPKVWYFIIPWRTSAARDTVIVWSVLHSFCRSVGFLGGSIIVCSV